MLPNWTQEGELPKLEEVVLERPGATEDSEPQNYISVHKKKCLCCRKEEVEMFRCRSCHAGIYCSKECQRKGWSDHKDLCAVIKQLEVHLQEVAKRNVMLEKEEMQLKVYSSAVKSADAKIAKLIGKRCSVECLLDGKETDVLWDTGSQPGLLGLRWLKEHFPETQIRNVSELLDPDENLVLTAANNEELDFVGFAELTFQIPHSSEQILVPFLITKENIEQPIIGTNIMTEEDQGKRSDDEIAGRTPERFKEEGCYGSGQRYSREKQERR